jgi:hypothetical protein
VRTAIADTAHGEDWVYRVKDLKGWWSNAHHNRVAGMRHATPTAWVPGMKPVRLTEFGCAAVDRGGNAPNLFQDAKSAENALPPFSTGARDDRMQRRALEAVLTHFAVAENNPASPIDGAPMIGAADAWCWDARPWPAFPARADVWADAGGWRTGHWLNGRLAGETRDLIAAVLRRGGLSEDEFEIGRFGGAVHGYVIDRPMRTRDALEPLLAALGLVTAERGDRVAVIGEEPVAIALTLDAMALPDEGARLKVDRVLEPRPGAARVRYIDGDADYQTGAVVVRAAGAGGGVDLDLPAVCSSALARAAAARVLEGTESRRLTATPGPLAALALEPADAVTVEGRDGGWRVLRLDVDETPSAVLEPLSGVVVGEDEDRATPDEASGAPGAPFFRMIELPPLVGSEDDGRPVAVVATDPWRPMRVFAGADAGALTARGDVARPATVGVLVEALPAGPRHRWDEANALLVRVEGPAPESRSDTSVLAGANAAAIETGSGWELVQFRTATLAGDGVWRLAGLLRGQQGTEAAGAIAGAVVVLLDGTPARAESARAERGLPLIWRAGPAGGPAGGAGVSEIAFTIEGTYDRPWSPAHLTARPRADGGIDLGWIPRLRIDGDRWDGVEGEAPAMRFRVRVLAGAIERRAFEAGTDGATYAATDVMLDFPGGFSAGSRVAVAQWGDGYGWGAEAFATLTA